MGAGEPEISLYSLDRESSSRRPWGEAITSTGTRHPDKAAPRLASCRLPQRVTADLGEAALQDCEQQETSEAQPSLLVTGSGKRGEVKSMEIHPLGRLGEDSLSHPLGLGVDGGLLRATGTHPMRGRVPSQKLHRRMEGCRGR